MVLLGYYCQRHKSDTCNVTCNELSFIDAPVVKSRLHYPTSEGSLYICWDKNSKFRLGHKPHLGPLFFFFFFFEIDVYTLKGDIETDWKIRIGHILRQVLLWTTTIEICLKKLYCNEMMTWLYVSQNLTLTLTKRSLFIFLKLMYKGVFENI